MIINSLTAYGLFDLIYTVTIDSCLCSWLRWVSLRSDWGGAGTVCRGLCVVHEAGECAGEVRRGVSRGV